MRRKGDERRTSQASSSDNSGADLDDLRLALDYSWKWFELHSSQRMQLINHLVVSLAFITAGYATSIGWRRFWVAAGVALGGILVCFVFDRLDIRTRELVRISESSLVQVEESLSQRAQLTKLNFVKAAAKPAARLTSYRAMLRILTYTGAALFVAAFVYALARAL